VWSWRFPCIASCLPIVWTHPHPAPSVLAHRSRHPIPILGHATTTHPVFPYCGCCCFSRSCSASTLTPDWLRQHGQEETPHAPECSLCILVLQCAIPGVPGLGPRGRVSSCALAIVGVATEDARKEIHGCVIRWGDVCAADIHLGNRGRRRRMHMRRAAVAAREMARTHNSLRHGIPAGTFPRLNLRGPPRARKWHRAAPGAIYREWEWGRAHRDSRASRGMQPHGRLLPSWRLRRAAFSEGAVRYLDPERGRLRSREADATAG